MAWHLIDMDKWERAEHYAYYRNIIKTRYNLNMNIDITNFLRDIKERGLRFYPSFLYVVMKAVNGNREFRISLDDQGRPGWWDACHPSYTIFHDDDKTFSDIWSEYDEDFSVFYRNVTEDMERYKDVKGVKGKGGKPDNFCPVSCAPWLSFTSHGCDTYSDSPMLFPVLVFGKYFEQNGRVLIPLSLSVNHAVADGYHSCKLFGDVQAICDGWGLE